MRKSLQQMTESLSNHLPFMEGREKGELNTLYNENVTITDFGFMNDKDGQYVAFVIKEDEKRFYFGGMVLTEQLQKLETEGYKDDVVAEGLPVRFTEKMSKNKKKYSAIEYYPS